MKCVDACFITRHGLRFTAVPLDLLEECVEQRNEMVNAGARSIVFQVNITNLEDGTEEDFEATDLLVRIGS